MLHTLCYVAGIVTRRDACPPEASGEGRYGTGGHIWADMGRL